MTAGAPFRLKCVQTLDLPFHGSHRNITLHLLGLDNAGRLAVEALYQTPACATAPDEDWIAQYVFDSDGMLLAVYDEDCGRAASSEPLSLTGFTAPPVSPAIANIFEYAGGRWRGLRDTDRVPDVLQSVTIAEKLALVVRGIPNVILGIAESRAMAAARIDSNAADSAAWTLVCRRLRIAYTVPLAYDAHGLPYDYDTDVLFLAQWVDSRNLSVPPLIEALPVGVIGTRPADALYDARCARLYVADNGDERYPAVVRVFQIETAI